MKIRAVQLVVEKDLSANRSKVLEALSDAQAGEWVVFPEAIASGYYPHEEKYTELLDWSEIAESLYDISEAAIMQKCHCILGSATKSRDLWKNSVLLFSPLKEDLLHNKNELSALDKKHFIPGKSSTIHTLDGIPFGVLACRELIFPALWSSLKTDGAKIIFHLNNAVQPHDKAWKHLLISRAIENSIFVVSVNNAASPQQLSSYIISPKGEILTEAELQKEQAITAEFDLGEVIANLSERSDY